MTIYFFDFHLIANRVVSRLRFPLSRCEGYTLNRTKSLASCVAWYTTLKPDRIYCIPKALLGHIQSARIPNTATTTFFRDNHRCGEKTVLINSFNIHSRADHVRDAVGRGWIPFRYACEISLKFAKKNPHPDELISHHEMNVQFFPLSNNREIFDSAMDIDTTATTIHHTKKGQQQQSSTSERWWKKETQNSEWSWMFLIAESFHVSLLVRSPPSNA